MEKDTFYYSVAIRTVGKAGDKFIQELESLHTQTIKPSHIYVHLAHGFERPKEQVGMEEYIDTPKGLVHQRAAANMVEDEYVLIIDDDVYFPKDAVEKMYQALVEHNADGTRGAVYDSAQGLSGGQAQKLVFFCLAAALRYQLTGAGLSTSRAKNCTIEHDGKQFSRFGTVILDEAFDRADSQFTRRGMDVFNEFGFHMVLATPEKMLQTIQDYIGGAAVVQCFDRKHSTLALLEIEDA